MSAKAKTVKSTKPTKIIRNVLVQPFKTKWPLVEGKDAEHVTQLLAEVPKDHIVVGINPALELLHTAKACVLLLTSKFHPQILGKQIIRMARRNHPSIKVLSIPDLKWEGSLQKIIAVRSGEEGVAQVDPLLQAMEKIIMANDYEDDLCSPSVAVKRDKAKQKKGEVKIGPEELAQLYLTRTDPSRRAFVPKISSYAIKSKASDDKGDWGEFISFRKSATESMEVESEEELEEKVESKLNISGKLNAMSSESLSLQSGPYIGLTVNRIQGDPNRKNFSKKKKGK